jgi:hypothetical protein
VGYFIRLDLLLFERKRWNDSFDANTLLDTASAAKRMKASAADVPCDRLIVPVNQKTVAVRQADG